MNPQDIQIFLTENWPLAAATVFSGMMVVYGFSATLKGYQSVSTEEAVRLINEGVQVFDLRSDEEFASGHLSGAKNIKPEALKESLSTLDKDKTYLLYCKTGTSSSTSCAAMKKAGFTNIKNLQLGLTSWRTANLPLVKIEKISKKESKKENKRVEKKNSKKETVASNKKKLDVKKTDKPKVS